MARKIAVIVRDRQSEAFRISSGLIMMDDAVDVFVLDRKISDDSETQRTFELVQDMGLNVYTNSTENPDLEYLSTKDIALKLLEYDIIDPY